MHGGSHGCCRPRSAPWFFPCALPRLTRSALASSDADLGFSSRRQECLRLDPAACECIAFASASAGYWAHHTVDGDMYCLAHGLGRCVMYFGSAVAATTSCMYVANWPSYPLPLPLPMPSPSPLPDLSPNPDPDAQTRP